MLEERVRRVVKLRLQRGQRERVAAAAGHLGPWLSGWLAHRQDATIDEMAAMLKALGLSLSKVIAAPDATALDWEVFGLMGRLTDDEQKQDARDLVAGLADHAVTIVSRAPSASAMPRLKPATRKSRRTG